MIWPHQFQKQDYTPESYEHLKIGHRKTYRFCFAYFLNFDEVRVVIIKLVEGFFDYFLKKKIGKKRTLGNNFSYFKILLLKPNLHIAFLLIAAIIFAISSRKSEIFLY